MHHISMVYGRSRRSRRKSHRKGASRRSARSRSYRKRSSRVRSYKKRNYASATRRFGKKVLRALRTTGSYNYGRYEPDAVTVNSTFRPKIGTHTDLGAGQGLFWFGDNPTGGNVLCAAELSRLIVYDSNPVYSNRDNTRSSTRVRIKGVRIMGRWHADDNFQYDARCYVDIEPHIYTSHATAFAYGDAVSPINFICDHKGVSNTETQTSRPPEDYYLIPNVQKGKHAFTEHHSKERVHRFHAAFSQSTVHSANDVTTYQPVGGPVYTGSTTAVDQRFITSAAGWGREDDGRCVTWNIPMNHIVEYPRTGSQELNGNSVMAIHPFYLAWTGKRSIGLDTGPLQEVSLGKWDFFSIYIFFEDIITENA